MMDNSRIPGCEPRLNGPFTTMCPFERTHWLGKKTCTVYDIGSKKKILSVPSYPYRSKEEALGMAEMLAGVLNRETGHDDSDH